MQAKLERWGAAAVCALLGACGSLVDMGGNSSANPRRMFVNDVAVNDSLRSAILNRGVYFVMQPGKQYNLDIRTGASDERLSLYVENGSVFSLLDDGIPGSPEGGGLSYSLQPPGERTSFGRYLVFLRSAEGGPGTRPERVRLFPAGEPPEEADSMRVKLLLVGRLDGLSSAEARGDFAENVLDELKATYAAYGVTLATSFEEVNPDAPPVNFVFSGGTTLPGSRTENTVHLYLVNGISADDSTLNQDILGVAPREAFDLDNEFSSRIVVSKTGGTGTAAMVATTAAHELGHFFGLRHTTATEQDLEQDRDRSNLFDGFASTEECDLSSLSKAAAPVVDAIGPEGTIYCLRVAATCPSGCSAVENLMFPYACPSSVEQRTMETEQRSFLRQNLWLYQ